MDDQGGRTARGFSSRAIHAATSNQAMAQPSSAVPTYQSATFASDHATGLAEAGISEGLLRVSVGLEDVGDLVAEVAVGLAAARSTVPA